MSGPSRGALGRMLGLGSHAVIIPQQRVARPTVIWFGFGTVAVHQGREMTPIGGRGMILILRGCTTRPSRSDDRVRLGVARVVQAKQAKSLAFSRCRTIALVSKYLSSIGLCEKSHSRGRGFDPHQLHCKIIRVFECGLGWRRRVCRECVVDGRTSHQPASEPAALGTSCCWLTRFSHETW
jgi:hypothetical protein